MSGRIKGRVSCGFEVSGARGSEERLLLHCVSPQWQRPPLVAEASQDLGASVMPKGLVHAPGGYTRVPVAPGGGDTRTDGP